MTDRGEILVIFSKLARPVAPAPAALAAADRSVDGNPQSWCRCRRRSGQSGGR